MTLTNWVLEGFSNWCGNLYALKEERDTGHDMLVCNNEGLTSFQEEVPASSVHLSFLLSSSIFCSLTLLNSEFWEVLENQCQKWMEKLQAGQTNEEGNDKPREP